MIINLQEHIPTILLPTTIPILLGSSSSNRRKIIKYLGWNIKYDSPNIDEKQVRTNNAYELPLKIASAKSDALLPKLNNETLLITCDQIVLCNGNILEKPETYEEAYNFFKSYSDNEVIIINAIVLLHYPSMRKISNTDISTIYFNNISDTNIHKIIANNNIFSSAGGIIIEDLYLYNIIKDINGSISSIMGLNYNLLISMINNIILLKK